MRTTKSIAFVTVIFPSNLAYFKCFLESLARQTLNDYTLLIANDGCNTDELNHLINLYDLVFEIVGITAKTPIEIRIELYEYLYKSDYDIFIFGDSDDFFSLDRVENILNVFEKHQCDIVFNDLSNVNQEGLLLDKCIWTERVKDKIVNVDLLLDCNVLGLGNTAIKRSLLKIPIINPGNISAFDWTFYLQLFNNNPNLKVYFSQSETFYRQHFNNTLGHNPYFSFEKLQKSISEKKELYRFCEQIGLVVPKVKKDNLLKLEDKILKNKLYLEQYLFKVNQKKNLFWFEETTLL